MSKPAITRVTNLLDHARTTNPVHASKPDPKTIVDSKSHASASASSTMVKQDSSSYTGSKRLSDAEVARKRRLGLCFKCDEKFSPNHKCKNKQPSFLMLSKMEEPEDEGDEGDEGVRVEDEKGMGEPILDEETVSLSMNSYCGTH